VAQYRYRHEAEFAAGILADAGIHYRLQLDDAGGADLGLSLLRPAVIWVRSVDAVDARDLVAWDDDEAGSPVVARAPEPSSERVAREPRLRPAERAVSAALGVACWSAIPYVPFGPYRSILVGACLAVGVAFFVATAVGRGPALLERIAKALAGSMPK
jgi:hypothetical protein